MAVIVFFVKAVFGVKAAVVKAFFSVEAVPTNSETSTTVGRHIENVDLGYRPPYMECWSDANAPVVEQQQQGGSAATPPFSIAVSSMTGVLLVDIPNLQPNTQVSVLCQKVAECCSMPLFAVRLVHQAEVLHMSWTGSLDDLGLKQGSRLTLLKQFGWAKPDLHTLCELQREWQGRA